MPGAGRKAKDRRREGGGESSPSRRAETSRARRILAGGAETVFAGDFGFGAIASGLSAVQCVQGGGQALSAAMSAGGGST